MDRIEPGRVRAGLGAALAALLIVAAPPASAHGGGLDKHGCHHDRKRGGYHCHRAALPAAGLGWAPSSRPPAPTRRESRPASPAAATTWRHPATEAYYPNCSAARAAGAAPLMRGDPGYSRRLDRDGDGRACE